MKKNETNVCHLSFQQLDRIAFAIAHRINAGEQTFTKQEAADYLKIKYKTFERRLSNGHYPAKLIHRDGGIMLFLKSELTEFIKTI
jgi:excisionase family DNA binding protein